MLTRLRVPLLVLVMALLSAACSMSSMSPAPEGPKTGTDVVIGVPNAVTGAYNIEGPLTRQGYDLWADWANGRGGIEVQGVKHKVRLVYQDDQSNPQLSAQIADHMLTVDKLQFLLGPYGTPPAATVGAVAEQHRVPVVFPTAGARQVFMHGFHYSFGILAPVDQYAGAVFDWELSQPSRPMTIAILTADDDASMLATQGAITAAAQKGIKVVYLQKYPAGTTNLYPMVQQAKAKNPDIFFDSGHFLEAVAAAKAARDLALDAKALSFGVGPQQPEFVQALGPVADYTITATPWAAQARFKADYGPSSVEYVAAYRQKYHVQMDPGFVTADATASGLALQLAMMHAGSLDPDKVRDALATLDVNTFYGRIKFDAQGQNTFHNVLVVQILNGQVQTVWPTEVASATGTWPTPTWEARFGIAAAPPKAKLPGTGRPPAR